MAKDIPPTRAVWLAKCVGAQEMRAFKRKGAGSAASVGVAGEAKWVKEWTGQVHQFLEGVINTCGTHGWKSKIEYAIRLVSYLYAEHLLDQEQYLEWILSSLEEATVDRLPLWLLMAQIYFKDLVATRQRGKRLAEALTLHLDSILTAGDEDICKQLVERLTHMSTTIAMRHRPCCIAVRSWDRIKHTLKGLLTWCPGNNTLEASVKNITRRNDALLKDGPANDGAGASPAKDLLKILDTTSDDLNLSFDIDAVSTSCLKAALSDEETIKMTLRWSTSHYRSGEYRAYLATRLIRKWKIAGLDTDTAILSFLNEFSQPESNSDEPAVFKIIAELCRSRHFSVGKYLRWLIASGAMTASTGGESIHRRLLAEIPLHGMPDNLANLRTSLLHSAGIPTELDTSIIARLRGILQSFGMGEVIPTSALEALQLPEQSLGVKTELARWIRQEVAMMTTTTIEKTQEDKPVENITSTITCTLFQVARTILEDLGDISILADVVGLSLSSNDTVILTACGETLNLHAKAFAAIGALGPLLKKLGERYGAIRSVQPLDRAFVFSYFDLTTNIGGDTRLLQQLKLDLSRCEQRAAVQMCSPASDGMGETYSSIGGRDGANLEDEIERALNSGNSMDEGAAGRVFARIVEVMGKVVSRSPSQEMDFEDKQSQSVPFEIWLQKLRAFDERVFERLVSEWITGVLSEQTPGASPLLSFAIPTIIGAEVADLGKSVDGAKKMIDTLLKIAPKQAATPALNVLLILVDGGLEKHELVEPQHWYRFIIEREKLQDRLMKLLKPLLDIVSRTSNDKYADKILALVKSEGLMAVVRPAAVRDVDALANDLSIGGSTPAPSYIETLLDHALDPNGELHISRLPKDAQVRKIIGSADDLSLPFCQLQIRHLLSSPSSNDNSSGDAMVDNEDGVESALLDAIKAAIDREGSSWAELLGGFGDGVCSKVRQFAVQQILNATDSLQERLSTNSDGQGDAAMLRRYLNVVDATTTSSVDATRSADVGHVIPSLADKLKGISDTLDTWQQERTSMWPKQVQRICIWIDALVHLCITHKHALAATNASDQLNFIAILCALMMQPMLAHSVETVEAIFDLLAFLSDGLFPYEHTYPTEANQRADLSPELRSLVSKIEYQRSNSDPRIAFLFGSSGGPEAWLGLVTSMSTLSTSGTVSTPKSSGVAAVPGGSPRSSSPAQQQAMRGSPSQQQHQAPALQRQGSQQRFQGGQLPQGAFGGGLPAKPGAVQGQAGNRPGYPQQPQARQVQQTWPPAQQQTQAQQQRMQAHNMHNQFGPGQRSAQNQPRPTGTPAPGSAATTQQQTQQKPQFNPPVPFPLRRWEILPDASGVTGVGPGTGAGAGSGTAGKEVNDTAISLTLFGARRVI